MLLNLKNLRNTSADNFFLIAGPCAIEDKDTAFLIAEKLCELTEKYKIPFIFKGSYRKANRSRIDSFTGIGDEKALGIIQEVGRQFNIPTTTDIHESHEAAMAAEVVDVLQIPAFLCRQTNLIVAAAATGKVVTIKKGQFMGAESMQHSIQKVIDAGNDHVAIIERGTTFGYQDLVVDFRAIPTMQKFKVPVIMDCTHSLQQPNQFSGVTGGKPELILTISKAAIAVGADGIFMETHPNPSQAKSDGQNMLPLDQMESILQKLVRLRQAILD